MINVSSLRDIGVLGLGVLIAVFVGYTLAQNSYDVQGLLIVGPVLGILGLLVLPRISRSVERFIFFVLLVGLIVKFVASFFRLYVAFDLYERTADAVGYDLTGRILADEIRRLNFSALAPYMNWGTEVMELSTGIIYAIIGTTLPGAYLVYGFIAFLGAFFYYCAFRVAFPDGNYKLYGLLVFLYPSIVFWPNGMSKDALMIAFIGLTAYGSSLALRKLSLKGVVLLFAGLLGMLVIRPHIAGILSLAIAIAFAMRGVRGGLAAPLVYVFGLGLSAFLAWFFVPRALDFVGLQTLDVQSTLSVLETRQSYTLQGGSAFQPSSITSPTGFPMALLTVLFRPFPWEANNLQALIQAMDGFLLFGIVLWRSSTLFRSLFSLRRNPYLVFIILYTIMFVVAFTAISNFGILARQRVQLLPLFMMLLAFVPSKTVAKENLNPVR